MDDLIDAAAVSLNVHPPKTKQREAVEAFMKGNDVFVALPTEYGKPVIFGILPAAYDILREHTESKSIVYSNQRPQYHSVCTSSLANYKYTYNIKIYTFIIAEKPAVTEPLIPTYHFDTIASNIYVATLCTLRLDHTAGCRKNDKSTCKHGTGRDLLASSQFVQRQSEHPNVPSPPNY